MDNKNNYKLEYILILKINKGIELFQNNSYFETIENIIQNTITFKGFDKIIFNHYQINYNYLQFEIELTPTTTPTNFIKTLKSMIAKEWFKYHSDTKHLLNGSLWEKRSYLLTTIDKNNNSELMIKDYLNYNKKEDINDI